MSRVNYDAMSDAQLKEYFLKHRGDQAAFQAYLDRINQRPLRIIASPSDPEGKVPDWVLIDGSTKMLFECKATRFSRAAQAM